MKRPFAKWAVVAIALGVAVGCKDDKKKSTDSNPPQNTQNTNPNLNGQNPNGQNPAGDPKAGGPGGRVTPGMIFTGDNPNGVPVGTPPNTTPPTGTTNTTPPTGAAGDVSVKQVSFAEVESAIAAAKGKVVLVDCWATWCGPCVDSFPKLVEKHNKYGSKGLAVISLSVDQPNTADQILPFLRSQKATFTNLHLTRDAASQKGLVDKFAYKNSIPHAALFDKTGNRVWAGHPMQPALEKTIEAELAK